MRSNAEKTAFYGIMIAIAMVLGFLERLIPMPIPVPGVKLGLANIVTVLVLYGFGTKEAFSISVFRIILAGLLFSGISGMMYSMAGGILSFLLMLTAKRSGLFSIVGVSVIGGVFHNFGQLALAAVTVENAGLFFYLPYLVISGEITGLIIGIIVSHTLKHLKSLKIINDGNRK